MNMMPVTTAQNDKKQNIRLDSQWSAFLRRMLGLQKGKRYVIVVNIDDSPSNWQFGEIGEVEKFLDSDFTFVKT